MLLGPTSPPPVLVGGIAVDFVVLLGDGVGVGFTGSLLLVLGGSGFFEVVGLGVDEGSEPSHFPPMQVMTKVWRGLRAWLLAGAWDVSIFKFACERCISV